MSKKPGTKQGNPRDKKKPTGPTNQNDLAKQEYLELDEEELEHRRQLDLKYRDRAKERREGLIEEEEEVLANDDENLVVQDGDEEYKTTVKGLDYDLLMKQKEKEAKERREMAASNRMVLEEPGTRRSDKSANGKREIKLMAKTTMGIGIHRALFMDQKTQGQRNIFKSSNCYDFDVNPDFGNTLPKLVIRNRDQNMEEEKPVSIKIGDNVLKKVERIMTYIKTGKRPEPNKEGNGESDFRKAIASKGNLGSSLNANEESDDDDIFPEAKKLVKTDDGVKEIFPEKRLAETEEVKKDKEQRVLRGLFNSIQHKKDDDEMEIEVDSGDVLALENQKIREKNEQLRQEMAQKRAEEKLAQLQERDKDYYTECFIPETKKISDIKESQKAFDKQKKKAKSKKRELNRQFDKVSKIMDDKRKGGGD